MLKHLPTCRCNSCYPHLPEPFVNPTSRLYKKGVLEFYAIVLLNRMWYVVDTNDNYFTPEFWEGLPYA